MVRGRGEGRNVIKQNENSNTVASASRCGEFSYIFHKKFTIFTKSSQFSQKVHNLQEFFIFNDFVKKHNIQTTYKF